MEASNHIRTRMAPSPTGEYHVGSMRTLLYNYALAKKGGGQFVLRIEDTDRERFVEGVTERLIQVIKDYGLGWDEGPDIGGPYGPYVQSQRLDIYKKYVKQLVAGGHAYYCFCTKERLDQLREEQKSKGLPSTKYDKHCLSLSADEVQRKLKSGVPYVIRLNVPPNEEITFQDKTLGNISFPTNDIDDQVLLKSDGYPTYHLAVVVDDFLMKINFIMRGVEWLPSTPKHILLYRAFGWELPVYAHLPLLKEKGDTKKLSKRMGSVAAVDFLAEGYLPEALLNFLMFLGWNPGTEKEIYSLAEFIKDFTVEKIHKTDLVAFDRDKLLWYNGTYIRSISPEELYTRLIKWALKFNVNLGVGEMSKEYVLKVLTLVQERMKVLTEFNQLTSYFFTKPKIDRNLLHKQAAEEKRSFEILHKFNELYSKFDYSDWTESLLDERSHNLIETERYKPKEAFMTLRVAVTGDTATPPIFKTLEVLGKNEVLERIRIAF